MNSNTDLFVDFKTLKTDQDTFDKIVQIKNYKFELPKKLIIKSGKIFIIIIQTILTILLLITKII